MADRIRPVVATALLALSGVVFDAAADRPGRGDQTPIQAPQEEEVTEEQHVSPPSYPRDSDLAEFKLRNPTSNRFFIDTSSLTVGKDRIVRFVMVIRTPENETNVRFAGLRCRDREWKEYAFVGSDRTWKIDNDAHWRRIQELRYNNYQDTLYRDYFCASGVIWTEPAGDAKKLARLLRYPPKPDPRVPQRTN